MFLISSRTPQPIVDQLDRIIAILAGQPRDSEGWSKTHEAAAEDIRMAGDSCSFTEDQTDHRRGKFRALTRGVSLGGGQTVSQHREIPQTF
jgi:hypothetical protein